MYRPPVDQVIVLLQLHLRLQQPAAVLVSRMIWAGTACLTTIPADAPNTLMLLWIRDIPPQLVSNVQVQAQLARPARPVSIGVCLLV